MVEEKANKEGKKKKKKRRKRKKILSRMLTCLKRCEKQNERDWMKKEGERR